MSRSLLGIERQLGMQGQKGAQHLGGLRRLKRRQGAPLRVPVFFAVFRFTRSFLKTTSTTVPSLAGGGDDLRCHGAGAGEQGTQGDLGDSAGCGVDAGQDEEGVGAGCEAALRFLPALMRRREGGNASINATRSFSKSPRRNAVTTPLAACWS
jgi:hypothetical protein